MMAQAKTPGKAERQPLRTGALTILFATVMICLAVLAVLGLVSAKADLTLAQKQQALLQTSLQAENLGQVWLSEADAFLQGRGALPTDSKQAADGVLTADLTVDDTHTLHVAIRPQAESYAIIQWQLETAWEEDTSLHLWDGK